jgi:hypothetical protein
MCKNILRSLSLPGKDQNTTIHYHALISICYGLDAKILPIEGLNTIFLCSSYNLPTYMKKPILLDWENKVLLQWRRRYTLNSTLISPSQLVTTSYCPRQPLLLPKQLSLPLLLFYLAVSTFLSNSLFIDKMRALLMALLAANCHHLCCCQLPPILMLPFVSRSSRNCKQKLT